MTITTEQLKSLSKLFAISGVAIETIDEVQRTPFYNLKLQRKLLDAQKHFERIFAAFHSANAQNETDTLEAQTHFVTMQNHYDDAIRALYNLDLDKLHLSARTFAGRQGGGSE